MSSKFCKKCDSDLPVADFSKSAERKGGLQLYCRKCMSLYYVKDKQRSADRNKARKKLVKLWVRDYKQSNPCVDCGVNYPDEPWLLEFDHLDPATKLFGLGDAAKSGSLKRIQEEAEKCELVCVLCHRRRTAIQFDWAGVPTGRGSKIRNNKWVREFKSSKCCVDCGVKYPDEPWILEFKRMNPGGRRGSISDLCTSGSLERVQGAVVEAELVCIVCSRRRSAKENGWSDLDKFDFMSVPC